MSARASTFHAIPPLDLDNVDPDGLLAHHAMLGITHKARQDTVCTRRFGGAAPGSCLGAVPIDYRWPEAGEDIVLVTAATASIKMSTDACTTHAIPIRIFMKQPSHARSAAFPWMCFPPHAACAAYP